MKIPRVALHSTAPAGARRPRRALLLFLAIGCALVTTGIATQSTAGPTCFGRAATRVGTGGSNTINGTPRSDVIVGLGGADTINGKAGRDYICGNRGEDVISGGRGADKMRGDRDIDFIAGNRGDDKMIGGGAGDELHGEIGAASDRDSASGRSGADFIDVQDGLGNDTAAGGAGPDTCNTDPGDAQTNC